MNEETLKSLLSTVENGFSTVTDKLSKMNTDLEAMANRLDSLEKRVDVDKKELAQKLSEQVRQLANNAKNDRQEVMTLLADQAKRLSSFERFPAFGYERPLTGNSATSVHGVVMARRVNAGYTG